MMEQEALKLVEELNLDTWIDGNESWWQPFEFVFNGYSMIKFMGEYVWDSENNDIEYDYDNDCPKYSLKEHVIMESKKILELLNKRMECITRI